MSGAVDFVAVAAALDPTQWGALKKYIHDAYRAAGRDPATAVVLQLMPGRGEFVSVGRISDESPVAMAGDGNLCECLTQEDVAALLDGMNGASPERKPLSVRRIHVHLDREYAQDGEPVGKVIEDTLHAWPGDKLLSVRCERVVVDVGTQAVPDDDSPAVTWLRTNVFARLRDGGEVSICGVNPDGSQWYKPWAMRHMLVARGV